MLQAHSRSCRNSMPDRYGRVWVGKKNLSFNSTDLTPSPSWVRKNDIACRGCWETFDPKRGESYPIKNIDVLRSMKTSFEKVKVELSPNLDSCFWPQLIGVIFKNITVIICALTGEPVAQWVSALAFGTGVAVCKDQSVARSIPRYGNWLKCRQAPLSYTRVQFMYRTRGTEHRVPRDSQSPVFIHTHYHALMSTIKNPPCHS